MPVRAATVEVGDGLVEDAAEQVRELRPAGAQQQLRGVGVPESARLLLGEDAVTRERSKQAVQNVGVDAGLARKLVHRPRTVGERLGDAQVGDDPQRLRHERPAQEVPEL